uniref:Uncharacterized protein n=1 Tax=Triticum urartu TaxID=4572 RepID=A0A8R7PT89_TRIUA
KTVNQAHQISICFISQRTPQPREEPPPPPPGNERSRRLQVTTALTLASIPSPSPSRSWIPEMPPIRDEPPPPRNETSRRRRGTRRARVPYTAAGISPPHHVRISPFHPHLRPKPTHASPCSPTPLQSQPRTPTSAVAVTPPAIHAS